MLTEKNGPPTSEKSKACLSFVHVPFAMIILFPAEKDGHWTWAQNNVEVVFLIKNMYLFGATCLQRVVLPLPEFAAFAHLAALFATFVCFNSFGGCQCLKP